MSKEIDQRVVQMEFDNKRFESNVATTMSTLDKLKQKLNFTGATKGLENVGAAADKVNMTGLGRAVETVNAKFSALQVMGVTALMNITNSAVNAGKRIVSALTIQPITTGFSEYELKMGSVQTIMASTGESLETVNHYLEELNKYSDQTIYSFADMTSNIGKFTNAGVKLEDAVMAMKGISNEAAVSGANANEASRAMYNFAQALSAGYVKLIDWKSIELANMATVEFKEQLIQSAVELGTVVKVGDKFQSTTKDLNGNVSELFTTTTMFNDSLSSQWMTTEVLVNTLRDYADETTDIGKKASKAATEVKTASQLFDTLKESAQSGWAQSWEIIVGDFYEAKDLFTDLSNLIGGFIDKISKARNAFLKGVLGSKWENLTDKIEEAGISTEDFQDRLKKLAKEHNVDLDKMIKKEGSFEKALQKAFNTKKLDKSIISKTLKSFIGDITGTTKAAEKAGKSMKELGEVVNKVIRGDFGNGAERIEKLTKAGYDYATVQNLVNEKLGISKRHTSALTEEQLKNADSLSKLSDAQLKNKGYTDEQIKSIRILAEQADKAGTSISNLIADIDKPSGRELLLDSFKNILEAILKPLNAVKEAWDETFGDIDGQQIFYNLIEGFHDLTEAMIISDESAENLKTVFEGLFAIFQLGHSIASMSIVGGLKILNAVLELFDLNILDVASHLAEYIIKFRDWVDEHTFFIDMYDKIAKVIKVIIDGVTKCAKAFANLKPIQDIISTVSSAIKEFFGGFSGDFNLTSIEEICKTIENLFTRLETWIKSLDNSENIGRDIILGIANGLKAGVSYVIEVAISIGSSILESIKSFLGIHSPSTKFFEVGQNIIQGLVNGIKSGVSTVWNTIKDLAKGCIDFISKIDFGALFATGISIGMLVTLSKIADTLQAFAAPFKGLGGMFDSIGDGLENMFKGIGSFFKAKGLEKRSKAILNFAIAIGILAASVYVLTKLDTGKMWGAIGAIAALAAIIGLLAIAINKLGPKESIDFGKFTVALLSISASVLILAVALRKLSGISWPDLGKGAVALIGLTILIALLMGATNAFNSGATNVGSTLIKISLAMLLLVGVIKIASMLDDAALARGGLVVVTLTGLIIGLMAATKLFNSGAGNVGSTLLGISTAMLMLVGVIRIISMMDDTAFNRGMGCIIALSGIIVGLMAATKLFNSGGGNVGSTLLAISTAMLLLALTIRIVGELDSLSIAKGLFVITAFGGIITGLIAATKLAGTELKRVGTTLIALSVAIGVLALVTALLGYMSVEHLAKGIVAVGMLAGIMALLIKATNNAQDCHKNLVVMAVAIGVMAVALATLSMIDASKLMTASVALGLVMGMFALIVKSADAVKTSMGTLITMTVVVGLLAGMIYALSRLEVNSTLEVSASISTLLLSMAGALLILNKMGKTSWASIGALAVMGLVVGELAIILGLLSLLDMSSALSSAAALSMLLLAMVGALTILSFIGPTAMIGVGAMALMGLVVGELAIILGLMSHFDVNPSIEVAKALSILLTSMSASLILLGVVGLMGPAAFIGIGALATLIAGIGGLIVGIGALTSKFPQLEEFLTVGIPILEKIGYAIGSFFGNIIGGFAGGVLAGLPEIGTQLSEFMTNATDFVSGVKMVDETAITGAENLAKAIIAFTAAEFLSGVADKFSGGSLSELGTELSNFMTNATPFIEATKNIDPSSMTGVKALAETIMILTSADIIDGLTSWFTGGSSLTAFGEEIAKFGPYMKIYSDAVSGIDSSAVEASANAAKALSEIANALPTDGGLISAITGDNDLATFGAKLVPFGKSLKEYSTTVDGINIEAIESSVKAAKKIVKIADAIPTSGGLVASITGDNDLAVFASKMVPFGQSLVAYSAAVSGTIDAEAISASIKSAKKIIEIADTVPKSGGLLGSITGDNDLAKFGTKMTSFGESLSAYSSSVSGVSAESVDASVKSAKKLFSLASSITDIDNGSIKSFKKAIETLGKTNVGDFVKAFSESTPKLSSVGGDMISALVKGVKSKQASLTNSTTLMVNAMIKAINSKKTAFTVAGIEIISRFINGIAKNKNRVKTAMTSATSSAVSGVREYYDNFYSAGSHLVSGFASGISANTFKAEAKARAMANAAEKAAKEALDINSPSKVFRKIGMSVPEGFAQGIDRLKGAVTASSVSMTDTAIYAVQDSISRIADAINTDMDSQPTIRPVLDLSDISAGARSISGMFAMSPSVGVLANVNAISSSMNNRQNGANNDDVVAAIKDLKDAIGEVSGDSYSVGDVTYDDGSNINDAVGALIGAIRRERRS